MVMRLGGLSTGIDTDTVVKQMLAREQARIDKVSAQKQVLQWQQETYRDFAGSIKGFKDKYFDVLNRGSYALSGNFFSSMNANIIGQDKGLISIKANNTAKPGRYEVKINQKATGAVAVGDLNEYDTTGKVTKKQTLNTKLSELNGFTGDSINIKVGGGTPVKIDIDGDWTINDLLSKINKDPNLKGKVNASFSEITGKLSIETVETGKDQKLEISGNAINYLGLNPTDGDRNVYSTTVPLFTPTVMSGAHMVNGKAMTDEATLEQLGLTGDNMKIKINGKEFILDKTEKLSDLGKRIEEEFKDADGNKTIKFQVNENGQIVLTGKEGADGKTSEIKIEADGTKEGKDILNKLGFPTDAPIKSFNMRTSEFYETEINNDLSSVNSLEINIDGKKFIFNTAGFSIPPSDDDLERLNQDLIDAGINDIKFNLDSETNKLTLRSEGTNRKMFAVTGKNDKLAGLGFTPRSSVTLAEDASIDIRMPNGDWVTGITNSKNSFTLDGINFDIKGISDTTSESIIFNVESNVDQAVDNIKGLVDAYNELIDSISSKIYEKKQYKYAPLTDEQKKDMKEDDIKRWEEKCKEGILRNDPALNKFISDLRGAFFEKTIGVNISLKDIGIDTSIDYTERGKLVIDEQKLRTALTERPDEVAELFTKDNPDAPYDKDKGYDGNVVRKSSVGIFRRVSDIIEDTIRTTRNTNNQKGSLLEKAGIKGDATYTENTISKQIKDKDELLYNLNRKLQDKETQLYKKFAYLEKMNNFYTSQSSWLTQQLGGM